MQVVMCLLDLGIVTCGPSEALVVSGLGYGGEVEGGGYRPGIILGQWWWSGDLV